MFVASNRREAALVNVARKRLHGQRAGLRVRIVPGHLLKERARGDHRHLHREIVMGGRELLHRIATLALLAGSTREVDWNGPLGHTDNLQRPRTNSRSCFEWFFPRIARSTITSRKERDLPNRIADLIVVFIHIVLILKIFALLIEFFGERISISHKMPANLQERNSHQNAAPPIMIIKMDSL